uniref:C-type lectin domain-containing protein n=1 Tax=Panagrolaimus sp. JU765 TaxID=591449 RepID=A0AC34RMA1_9BILA
MMPPIGCVQAEGICAQDGGHLASIHDAKENEFVAHIAAVNLKVKPTGSTWIGLKWAEEKKKFEWTDQSPVDYFNWKMGDPKAMQVMMCTELYPDDDGNPMNYRMWGSQAPFFTPNSFVCKMDAS